MSVLIPKNLLVKTKEEQKPIDDTVIANTIAPHNRNRYAAADDGREIKERQVNAHTLFGSFKITAMKSANARRSGTPAST